MIERPCAYAAELGGDLWLAALLHQLPGGLPCGETAQECRRVDSAAPDDERRTGAGFLGRSRAVRDDRLPARKVGKLTLNVRERNLHRAGDVRSDERIGIANVDHDNLPALESLAQVGD